MNKLLLLGIILISSTPVCLNFAFANEIKTSTAQEIYTVALKNAPPENDGDGIVHKTGTVDCSQWGMKVPFQYKCNGLSISAAKDIYLNALGEIAPENDGDGVVSKSAYVTCTKVGTKVPFSYGCSFSN